MIDAVDFKTAADIGLGAVSLLLWFGQAKTNRQQNKATQDLTTMVKEHDNRIDRLETNSGRWSRALAAGRVKRKQRKGKK